MFSGFTRVPAPSDGGGGRDSWGRLARRLRAGLPWQVHQSKKYTNLNSTNIFFKKKSAYRAQDHEGCVNLPTGGRGGGNRGRRQGATGIEFKKKLFCV